MRFWDVVAEKDPARRRVFLEMKESFQFLNRLRDVYRLSVAPVDTLNPEHMDRPAEILGCRAEDGRPSGKTLLLECEAHLARVAGHVDELIRGAPDS
jgi:hypothetical protein